MGVKVSREYHGCVRPVTPEKLEAVRKMVEDGASQKEIIRTVGVGRETIVKYFPGHRWTFQECGSLGRAVRTAKQQGLL